MDVLFKGIFEFVKILTAAKHDHTNCITVEVLEYTVKHVIIVKQSISLKCQTFMNISKKLFISP